MTWLDHHRKSEQYAFQAEAHLRQGEHAEAKAAYRRAAQAEERTVKEVADISKRFYGVFSVSAVALYYKAGDPHAAEQLAHTQLSTEELPKFAQVQLRELLQEIWEETTRDSSGIRFESQKVVFSIKGDTVLRGAAPLDLVLGITKRTQSLFHRVAELTRGYPHRMRGHPPHDILKAHEQWLVQTPPGSYQFAIGIREPMQRKLFTEDDPTANEITGRALAILSAGAHSPDQALADLVPDADYRRTFLKLTRDLSPASRRWTQLEISSEESGHNITLNHETRRAINDVIRAMEATRHDNTDTEEEIIGVLRGVDLERDWIEVVVDGERVKVHGVGETVDDLIGPMVNQQVVVTVGRNRNGTLHFRDVEPFD